MLTDKERLATLEEKVDSLEKRMDGNGGWVRWVIGIAVGAAFNACIVAATVWAALRK